MSRIKGVLSAIHLPTLGGAPCEPPSSGGVGGGFRGGDKWGLSGWGPTHPHTSSGDLLGRAEALGWGLG